MRPLPAHVVTRSLQARTTKIFTNISIKIVEHG
jgi:hypothetical protein